MSSKFSTARITAGGERFEILVKPNLALDYKMGKPVPLTQILAIEEVYSDASKGTRASTEKLQKVFGTTEPVKIAEEIMKRGELQLTTDQRRHLVEDKRKAIVSFISFVMEKPSGTGRKSSGAGRTFPSIGRAGGEPGRWPAS